VVYLKTHLPKCITIKKPLSLRPSHGFSIFGWYPLNMTINAKQKTISFMEMISNAWYSMEGTPMVSHGMGYGWLYGIK
jgi:hypothetical protein